MNNEEYVNVPLWVMKNIDNTLRECLNIFSGEDSCVVRDIKRDRICVKKLLTNQEITGHERFENYKL